MPEILTLEETKKRHKELWMWIAEETRKRKRKVMKWEFFLSHEEYETPDTYLCWCCKFAEDVQDIIKILSTLIPTECAFCPVKDWKENDFNGFTKLCNRGLYGDWWEVCKIDYEKAADLAEQIANLPFKKAFDITPEQAKMLRNKGFGEIYSIYEKER